MIKTQIIKHQFTRLAMICFFALIAGFTAQAQTITNPGFEMPPGTVCPTDISQLNLATPWTQSTAGTTDYFNCSFGTGATFPTTTAQSGAGFMGQYVEDAPGMDYKEYATTPLSAPMVAGKVYKINFYIRFGVGPANGIFDYVLLPVAERGFYGAMFSTTAPTTANTTDGSYGSITNTFPGAGNGGKTFLPSSDAAYSTANTWMPISLTYTAVGGEQYMTLGQFRPATTSLTGYQTSYVFVDNISVVKFAQNASLTKSVSPASIPSSGTATYTFTINNTVAGSTAQTGLSFTDALPSGLRIAATPNIVVTGLTAGTTVAAAGGTSISASGYSLAAGATGTITVNVTNAVGQFNTSCGANPAAFTNGNANITSTSANLTNSVGNVCLAVSAVNPVLTKSVSPAYITNGDTATYTFTVDNTAVGNGAQTGISFTDALPSGLRIAATPNIVVTGLAVGTTTAAAGGTTITAAGYSIAAGAVATITVNVTNAAGQLNTSCGANPTAFTNGSSNITSKSTNLTNSVGNVCLTVVAACAAAAGTVTVN